MQEADAQPERAPGSGPDASSEGEVSLLTCILLIHRRRRLIYRTVGAFMLLALVVSLCLPDAYEATTTVISPEEGGTDFGAMMAFSSVAQTMTGLSLPSMTPNRDLFVSILESRTLRTRTVERFALQGRYGVESLSEALEALDRKTSVSVSPEGVIGVTVSDGDPQLAADIANFQVATLESLLLSFKLTAASKQRTFVAERLEKIKIELRDAEDALRAFRVKHKLFGMDEQAKGIAEVARDLAMEIAGYEAQLQYYRENYSPTNPELLRVESLVREKERQLNELKYGTSVNVSSPSPESLGGLSAPSRYPDAFEEKIYVPIIDLPEVGLELARLTRDAAQKNAVYTLLVQELERARIAEARELIELQRLDVAVPPDRTSRPGTLFFVSLAGGFGLFASVFLAFFLEYTRRLRDEYRRLRMETIEAEPLEQLMPDPDGVASSSNPAEPGGRSSSTDRGEQSKSSRKTKAPTGRRRKRKSKAKRFGVS